VASKFQIITELSNRTAHSITDNHINWTSFLTTAAWNYKYKFQEQLLIFAQKPEATACASIVVWNNLGRWVNKGAKGIAMIDDSSSTTKLRHNTLAKNGLQHFDSWASTFGETVTAIDIARNL
jgi:hypothetical protein